MTIINRKYILSWKMIYHYHGSNREELKREIQDWHKGYSLDSDFEKLKRLEAEYSFRQDACLYCLETSQHNTIADYAEWLFKNFGPAIDESFYPPFESFKTAEDVRKAFQYLHNLDPQKITA